MTSRTIPIPPGASVVVVLEQFAHLDWDWQNPFPTNVDGSNPIVSYFGNTSQPANTIYAQAHDLLTGSNDYYYATCEIGFLREFARTSKTAVDEMIATGRLRIVGGGITSPDNLLPHGECFFRNYLVGLHWMASVSLPWTRCVWLPDDFGHDSQLPVMLAAMDAEAVAFSRCPLAPAYKGGITIQQPTPAAGTVLYQSPSEDGGCDFFWKAADGSQLFAHWIPYAYYQGASLYDGNPETIRDYLEQNQNCSPTPYIHVPVGADFIVPLGGGPPPQIKVKNTLLESIIPNWNAAHPDTPAVLSTFDQYVASVLALVDSGEVALFTRTFHGDPASPDATTFRSNPNFMGFYASRMNIKSLHHQVTRVLLAAETLDLVLAAIGWPDDSTPATLLDLWDRLVPSTHHDYITGTATDQVVSIEQMPLLTQALADGQTLIASQLEALQSQVSTPSVPGLLVFNPIGVAASGLVELTAAQADQLFLSGTPTQTTAEGKVLLYANSPSTGYAALYVLPTPPAAPTCTSSNDGATWTIANEFLSATIEQGANWALTGVTDVALGRKFLARGNELSFWSDHGNIYQFEYECARSRFALLKPTVTAGAATPTENGPLRVTVSATLEVSTEHDTQHYTLQYSLTAGEPFLRMAVIGQALTQSSVFASFTFAEATARIEHGTPYHWDSKTPATFGTSAFAAVFEPTHDFVVPYGADGALLGALYHRAVPAWAISGSAIVAAIFRDTPGRGCNDLGADGTDCESHVIEYALRVPTGMSGASSGQPLQEARVYNTPLYATIFGTSSGSGKAPLEFSLATVQHPRSAMVTAIKRGTFDSEPVFMRVYQPTNEPAEVTVKVGFDSHGASAATALEQVPTRDAVLITTGLNTISFKTQRAVTTVRIPALNPNR